MSRLIALCLPGLLLLAPTGKAFGDDPTGIEGKWKVGFNGHDTEWTFTMKADGKSYSATETKSADNATGTATYDKETHVLTLEAMTKETPEPTYRATYTWTMKVNDTGLAFAQEMKKDKNGKDIPDGSVVFTRKGGKNLTPDEQKDATYNCYIKQ